MAASAAAEVRGAGLRAVNRLGSVAMTQPLHGFPRDLLPFAEEPTEGGQVRWDCCFCGKTVEGEPLALLAFVDASEAFSQYTAHASCFASRLHDRRSFDYQGLCEPLDESSDEDSAPPAALRRRRWWKAALRRPTRGFRLS